MTGGRMLPPVNASPMLPWEMARQFTIELCTRLRVPVPRIDRLAHPADAHATTDGRKFIRYRDMVPASTVVHEVAHIISGDLDHGPRWRAVVDLITPDARAILDAWWSPQVASPGDG